MSAASLPRAAAICRMMTSLVIDPDDRRDKERTCDPRRVKAASWHCHRLPGHACPPSEIARQLG